jgi:3,4-dihydroxy 2-butanone 4-phosphate synthase/GTP cyclohydrolase II
MSGNLQKEQHTEKGLFNTIDEAVEEIRRGNIIIVVDDEDRENEGDFVVAAELISPEKVNFMATHGRGLICTALTEERCAELELDLMVGKNTSLHQTAFTVATAPKRSGPSSTRSPGLPTWQGPGTSSR